MAGLSIGRRSESAYSTAQPRPWTSGNLQRVEFRSLIPDDADVSLRMSRDAFGVPIAGQAAFTMGLGMGWVLSGPVGSSTGEDQLSVVAQSGRTPGLDALARTASAISSPPGTSSRSRAERRRPRPRGSSSISRMRAAGTTTSPSPSFARRRAPPASASRSRRRSCRRLRPPPRGP